MSAPSVFFGWTPVSQVAPARAWSPAPSPKARPLNLGEVAEHEDLIAERLQRLHGRHELEAGAVRRRHPILLNDAVRNIDKPEAHRRRRRGQARAAIAGIMESSSGKASAVPTPRRNMRRSRAFFVMIMILGSSSFEIAGF